METIKKAINFMVSMKTALWALGGLSGLMLASAFLMPALPEYETMNSMPLFHWMKDAPLRASWWLWASFAVIGLLCLNTLACSIDSVIKKKGREELLLIIAPQVIHIGFLLLMLAHLLSASGGFRGMATAVEGGSLRLPDGTVVGVEEIIIKTDEEGYLSDYSARINFSDNGQVFKQDSISPNNPSLARGMAVYLKKASLYPRKSALIEVARDPGALCAFWGGMIFTIGTFVLIALKIKRER